jgi:hypothetical protein
MWYERLNQKLAEDSNNCLDLLGFASPLSNPCFSFWPSLVQCKQTALASSLDELIWLCNKLGAWLEEPRVCVLGLVKNSRDLGVFWEIERGEFWRRIMRCGFGEWRWLNNWCAC